MEHLPYFDRMTEMDYIFNKTLGYYGKEYSMDGKLDWFFRNNLIIEKGVKKAKNYHNIHHLYGVAMIADFLMVEEYGTVTGPEHLLIALMHDYDYDENIKDDITQVKRSGERFVKDFCLILEYMPVNPVSLVTMNMFMSYPHVELNDEGVPPYMKKVIEAVRSADLIYSTVFCSLSVLNSLYDDYVKPREKQNWPEFIGRNVTFLRELKVPNNTAQVIHKHALKRALKMHCDFLTYR